jgi:hypothetical protein
MDPILDKRLQAMEEKIDETHRVVMKVRRVQKRAETTRILYWLFLILLGLGAFYFIQPVVNQFKGIYNVGASESNNFNEFVRQLQYQQDN